MAEYVVETTRSFSVTVRVTADSAEEAAHKVSRSDFDLPSRDAWSGQKDWRFHATNVADSTDEFELD